jgi:hypothetical protein
MKFFAMKSGFDCPARPSSIFAPIDVPASRNFILKRRMTGPRSWSRMQSLDTLHAYRKERSQSSCSSIMDDTLCRIYARLTAISFPFAFFLLPYE